MSADQKQMISWEKMEMARIIDFKHIFDPVPWYWIIERMDDKMLGKLVHRQIEAQVTIMEAQLQYLRDVQKMIG